MATPRIPIRGLLAVETRLCLDRLAKAELGELIPYAELDAVTGCNVRQRRNVIMTSIKKLLTEQAMVFIAERNEGIRRLRNEEIPSLGQRDIGRIGRLSRRATRRLAKAGVNTQTAVTA